MPLHRSWLARAVFTLAHSWMHADVTTERQVAQFQMEFEEVLASMATFLSMDRDDGRNCEDEDERLFETLLKECELTETECAKARDLRAHILSLANAILDNLDFGRGDDPAECDPGGGMGDPDDRDPDDPW